MTRRLGAWWTRYGGNGLALKIVGETIRQIYDGDVGAFLDGRDRNLRRGVRRDPPTVGRSGRAAFAAGTAMS